MSTPTAAQLVERLRDLHSRQAGRRLSDEDLAPLLPIGLRSLKRWKRSDTVSYTALVEMLDRAGWLAFPDEQNDENDGGDSQPPRKPPPTNEELAAQLEALRQLVQDYIGEHPPTEGRVWRDRPRRRARQGS